VTRRRHWPRVSAPSAPRSVLGTILKIAIAIGVGGVVLVFVTCVGYVMTHDVPIGR